MSILSHEELLRRLVAIDSTSSLPNEPIADFIADYLDRPGITVEKVSGGAEGKLNLLATIGEPDQSRVGLVLSGHMDAVPANPHQWTTPPFEMQERDGNLYGRGTADMKAFLALSMNAAVELVASPRPLVLLFTCDEEIGCLGAGHFVKNWPEHRPLPRSAIIGEPTRLRVVRMHKGHLKLRITLKGKGAHSGYPHLGRNAIEKAGPVIGALSKLRTSLESERYPSSVYFDDAPFVPLNLGTIHGGSAINIVPDECVIEVGMRPLPGVESEELGVRLREAIRATQPPDDWLVELISESPPLLLDEASEICRTMYGLVDQSGTASVSFASDAGWLQRLGIECLLFGPGSIEVAHRPDEFIPRDEIDRGYEILKQAIDYFCRSEVTR